MFPRWMDGPIEWEYAAQIGGSLDGMLAELELRQGGHQSSGSYCFVAEEGVDMPEMRTLMTGLAFVESPRWHDDRLWFSDWIARELIAVDLEGRSEVIVRMPSFPFSIDWLRDGRLLVVSGREGLLLRREPDGSLVTHADLTSLSDKGWNELVVDGRGNAYINGAGFDLMAGEEFAPGVMALVTPDSPARQVAASIAFPNGMAVVPDNSTVWADLNDGVPDGICTDAEGAVWYGDVPNKRCVRVREGGEVLQTINLDRG